MTPLAILRTINSAIDRWLTTSPVAHAPQSLGIFRIIYALFYLWYLSFQRAQLLAGLPADSRAPIVLVTWFPFDAPPIAFQAIESILVACIVLLLFGWRTRVMTTGVLITGALLEALFSVGDKENGAVFLTFFIPLFMMLAGAPWGEAYSLDAARHGARDAAPCHALPVRATLVILSVLFFCAAMNKMFGSGIWLREFKVMANFGLYHNVQGALLGLRLNPWAANLKELPILHVPMQFAALLFEATFFLALLNRRLLRLYVGIALVFQSVNALLFVVTFAPLAIAFGLFIDWESIRQSVTRHVTRPPVNTRAFTVVALTISIVIAATWNFGTFTRSMFSLRGAIDWRSIFWPILPLGIWLIVSAVWQIGRALTTRARVMPHVAASR